MKIFRIACFLIILALALPVTALGYDTVNAQSEAINTDAVEDSLGGTAADIMEGESIKSGVDINRLLGKLASAAKEKLSSIVKESVVSASLLVLAAMLCSVASSFIKTGGLGDVDYITLVGIAAVSSLSFGGVRSFVSEATLMADEIGDFSKMLLPALTAAASASGNISSATAKYAVITMFLSLMISVIRTVILPLVYAYMAASIASAAFGGDGLSGASSLMKWAATNVLIVLVLAFTVYITISGVVTGTADAAATRLTKTVLSTALPVVGGIISDAAQTVLTGASVLKNSIGIYGLFAVLAICLVPFLRLGVNYVIYKGAALLASAVSDKAIGKAISSIGTAIGIILGASGSCAMMLFFSIISVIKAVTVL